MTSHQYKHPPITEAVIEIRLEDSLSESVVEKIHKRLKKSYESSETISLVGIRLDPKKEKIERIPDEFEAYKLTSKDQADVVQIKPNAMVCSRLAPYNGWVNFEPRARENWEIWRKTAKHTKIKRIGVRYINRIDIPFRKEDKIDIEDYLTIVPKYPEPHLLTGFTNYTMQIKGPFSIEGFYLIINTNVVKSPLIDHCMGDAIDDACFESKFSCCFDRCLLENTMARLKHRYVAYGTVRIDVETHRHETLEPECRRANGVSGFNPNHRNQGSIVQEAGESGCRSRRRARCRREAYSDRFAVNSRGRARRVRFDRFSQILEPLGLPGRYRYLGNGGREHEWRRPHYVTYVKPVHFDQALH